MLKADNLVTWLFIAVVCAVGAWITYFFCGPRCCQSRLPACGLP